MSEFLCTGTATLRCAFVCIEVLTCVATTFYSFKSGIFMFFLTFGTCRSSRSVMSFKSSNLLLANFDLFYQMLWSGAKFKFSVSKVRKNAKALFCFVKQHLASLICQGTKPDKLLNISFVRHRNFSLISLGCSLDIFLSYLHQQLPGSSNYIPCPSQQNYLLHTKSFLFAGKHMP